MGSLIGWNFEALELVEALQRDARHVLAERAGGVGEHLVVPLVPAYFSARFEAVGGEVGTGEGHLLVLLARRAKAQSILVVERLGANHAADLRCEHIGDVSRKAGVLSFRVAADGV